MFFTQQEKHCIYTITNIGSIGGNYHYILCDNWYLVINIDDNINVPAKEYGVRVALVPKHKIPLSEEDYRKLISLPPDFTMGELTKKMVVFNFYIPHLVNDIFKLIEAKHPDEKCDARKYLMEKL